MLNGCLLMLRWAILAADETFFVDEIHVLPENPEKVARISEFPWIFPNKINMNIYLKVARISMTFPSPPEVGNKLSTHELRSEWICRLWCSQWFQLWCHLHCSRPAGVRGSWDGDVPGLVNIQKTMERSTIFNGKIHENPLFLWPFSIAFCKFTRGYRD